MNKYKLILSISILGLISPLSASGLDNQENREPLSPQGRHGTGSGGMCNGLPSSKSAESFALAVRFPTAIMFKLPNGKITARFPVSTTTRVAEFIAYFLGAYGPSGVSSAIRFMLNGEEIMRNSVWEDGSLVTLGEIFSGVSGVPTIDIIEDKTRSPLHSPTETPPPASLKDEMALPGAATSLPEPKQEGEKTSSDDEA